MKLIENFLTNNDCYRSGRAKDSNDGVQMHTVGTAQNTALDLMNYWNQPGIEMCVNYVVSADLKGVAYHTLPDGRRTWADAGYGNGHLITIELMESDYMAYERNSANYTITNKDKFVADITRAYETAIELVASLCKEYGWNPKDKLANGLHRVSSHDEGRRLGLSSGHVDPTHIWGHIGKTMDIFRDEVAKAMANENQEPEPVPKYTMYTDIRKLSSEADKAQAILNIVKDIAPKYELLPSVIAAQAILESGYCSTKLSNYNNILGMKVNLVNSAWSGSAWDGRSKVLINTPEVYNGTTVYIDDYFRVYPCLENCIEDICAFFSTYDKYVKAGVKGCSNYRDQITIESKCGYATDPKYIEKVCALIEKFDLAKFDKGGYSGLYYVRLRPKKCKEDMETQIGAYKSLAEAKKKCSSTVVGYKIYDDAGKVVYDTGKLTPEAQIAIATDWAISIARDDSHGYNNEYNHRGGNPDYACSSYVNQAWREAGLSNLKESKDTYTADMKATYLANGFEDVSSKVNLKTGSGVKKGDVLLTSGHVEMCINDQRDLAGARGNAPTNLPENGAAGDQTGGEIAVIGWWNDNWHTCLRLKTSKPEKRYWVQCGSFDVKDTAVKHKKYVTEKTGYKAAVIKLNGKYIVRAGKYEFKRNAEKKARKVKAKGVDCFVKYVAG